MILVETSRCIFQKTNDTASEATDSQFKIIDAGHNNHHNEIENKSLKEINRVSFRLYFVDTVSAKKKSLRSLVNET